MLKIIIAVFLISIFIPLNSHAAPEPRCKSTCLKAGYYSVTCDSICYTDESLGRPYSIAKKQFQCMQDCEENHRDTLMGCIFDCRNLVRKSVADAKKHRIDSSITEAEAFIEKKQVELEETISKRMTSKEIDVKRPEPLIID